MQDSSKPATGAPGAHGAARNGGAASPLDRSHLLRKASKYPFPMPATDQELVRLRRSRRVSASFSGIPPLARTDRFTPPYTATR